MSYLDRIASMAMGQRPAASGGRIAPAQSARAMPIIGDSFLTDILDTMDKTPERQRLGDGEGEYGHYTHVSSLIGACDRQLALASQDGRTIMDAVTGGHRVMWEIGRAVEKHIRRQFIRSTGGRWAFGHWRCACHQTTHTGHQPAHHCPRCDKPLDEYVEYTLYDHENWIKGNPDLIIQIDGWTLPNEVKSMNPEDFKALTAPLGDHVFQVANYHRMLELAGFRVFPFAKIIYCTKQFKFGSPYKEYTVDMTAPAIRTLLDDAVLVAQGLRRAREQSTLPRRQLCTSHNSPRAKQCPFVVQCFSLT